MSQVNNQQDTQRPLSLLETFQKRHSARTFQGQNLTQDQKDFISQSITEANTLDTPFHSPGVKLDITGPGLGRFFMISDEAGYIVLKIPINEEPQQNEQPLTKEQKQKIDVAYIGQHLAMKLTQNHIDSVWVAGTYNESEAERRFQGFKVPCSIAYGIESETPHFALKMVKFIGVAPKPGQRLPFEQLFYDGENKKTITEADLDQNSPINYPSYFKDFVTSLRSGPSAGDRQPWRFVLCGKEVHLFDARMSNFSPLDIGVALANLNLLSEIRGGECNFEVRNPEPEASPLGGTYIATAIYLE